ncbi:hypothetical protein BJ878DRAFT_561830 [Calycina marina]|uniref:U1-type domain-containing protein n=1 Tax=Calycina marina TaxID=1763456 RepID=A0A9P7ZBJ1_9HELO|nr:hypothetical protein BJ878DRAFT_561830 [Calycina marina]
MSEYWKSTPKYWCKRCKLFIRDTKRDKAEHEQTPKHQGNLKRFLRDLHRGVEQEDRNQQRAKDEVARLNGMVSGISASGSSAAGPSARNSSGFKVPVPRAAATAEQVKKQRAQLAELGVAIPDEFRPDLAMTGEWQVVSERLIEPEGKKNPAALATGVRKREDRGDDEDDEVLEAKRMRFESRFRTHPVEEDTGDLDALLSNVTRKGKEAVKTEFVQTEVKDEPLALDNKVIKSENITAERATTTRTDFKSEQIDGSSLAAIPPSGAEQKAVASTGIVFKKRKAKNIRHK